MGLEGKLSCAAPFALPGGCELRLLDAADADSLHAAIEANREHLCRWLPWAIAQTERETAGFVREAAEQLARNDGFQMAIVEREHLVGVIGYPAIDWRSRATRIGYWLSEDRQGRGTMTAAARLLVSHALDVWRLNRVEIRAAVENRRSRAIPERLGFREEGTLRQAERVGDRYLDSVVYSMLAGDWVAAGGLSAQQPGEPR